MHDNTRQTVDHLFRHESGKMIAVLSKLLGIHRMDVAQDIVQDTLLQALRTWPLNGQPENAEGWLYRVARNKAVDYLRRQKTFEQVLEVETYNQRSALALHPTISTYFEMDAIEDSQLQMMFACCHPSIAVDSQIAFTLKTLCGLSVAEIAHAFLKDEETIAKRIYRAKEKIKSEKIILEVPSPNEIAARLDAVLHCLYLLFNEGYNSSHPEHLIREELCEDAMRMAFVLTKNKLTNLSQTNALLALFCFQASRLKARLDDHGNIILLKYQDRSKWYQPLIKQAYVFMEAAAKDDISVYHLQAAIAYYHAVANSFEATDWKTIYTLYGLLLHDQPSPFVALNKAIAAGYALDKETALEELSDIEGLEKYYLYHTAIGEIYFDLNDYSKALIYYNKALRLTNSGSEKQLLLAKISVCNANASS